MKKFIKLIAKNLAAQTIAFLLLVWFITFAAITWPSQTPAWETSWWKFQSYFNNLKWNCPSWQAVVWINNDFTKKCGDIIQIPTPTPINWVCNTSTRGWCSSWSVYWINNTTSCWTTATWTCKWSNWWTDSSQCSYYNWACTPTTPTCPTNYSYISVNGVSGCYTLGIKKEVDVEMTVEYNIGKVNLKRFLFIHLIKLWVVITII